MSVLYLSSIAPLSTVPGTPPDSGVYRALIAETPKGTATWVTNTSAGAVTPPSAGTHLTDGAGGDKLTWVSPPLVTAVTLSGGGMSVQLTGLESNAAANASFYARLGKLKDDGTYTWFASSVSAGAEFSSGQAGAVTQNLTVTSTDFAVGDRLVLEVYLDDATGVTLGNGYTVTINEGSGSKLTIPYQNLEFGGAYRLALEADPQDNVVETIYAGLTSVNDVGSSAYAGLWLGLTAPVDPVGELIGIAPTATFYRSAADGNKYVRAACSKRLKSSPTQYVSGRMNPTPQTLGGSPLMFGINLPQLADIDIADVMLWAWADDRYTLLDYAHATAYYLQAATCATPSLPTGTMTQTQTPRCAVSVSAVVEPWQIAWPLSDGSPVLSGIDVEFAVYTSDDAPGATPPDDAEPLWTETVRSALAGYDGGISQATVEVTAVPAVALANGDYVVYVRVSRDCARGPRLFWSDWSRSAEWTINVPLPDAPTALTITADEINQRIEVKAVVPTTAGYTASTALLSVERSDDLGSTWTPVRNMSGLSVTAGATEWTLGYDVLAPRGVSDIQYRVRATMLHATIGTRFVSGWLTVTGIAGLPELKSWMLIALDNTQATWPALRVVSHPWRRRMEVGEHEPLDRSGVVTDIGPYHGRTSTLTVTCEGTTEVARLRAIERYRGVCLLGSPFEDAKFVVITDMSGEPAGDPDDPFLRAMLTYTEVASP